jgi:hypothetical protein
MSRKFLVLLLIISASLTMAAQTYRITPVITPDTVIDGQSIRPCLRVDTLAINDSAEIAFSTYCRTGDYEITDMLFTSRHLIAKDGDVIDGKHIKVFPTEHIVVINSHGQVAYLALYVDDWKDAENEDKWRIAICVDHHIVSTFPPDQQITSLTLTDEGKVSFNQPVQQIAPTSPSTPSAAAQKIPGILRQIPIKLPSLRLPKNVPIGIPSIPQVPQSPSGPANAPRTRAPLFPTFASNSRGQIVIPANLPDGHFVILLASPTN